MGECEANVKRFGGHWVCESAICSPFTILLKFYSVSSKISK